MEVDLKTKVGNFGGKTEALLRSVLKQSIYFERSVTESLQLSKLFGKFY